MDGFLNINKPAGWTSHDVVAHLRNVLGKDGGQISNLSPPGYQPRPSRLKVGHTGTLDPAATGVLPICVGKATKLAELLTDSDKEYRAVMRLGETTDTQDATGKVLSSRPVDAVTDDRIRTCLAAFVGEIQQVPPMYSAVKVNGQPLYKAARAGREVRRAPRTVRIHRLEFLERDGTDVALQVVCSKGTYIRTLCADIGERLGTGAHLYRLERIRSGPFRIEQALTLDEVEATVKAGRIRERLIPPALVLADFPCVSVTADGARHVMHGAMIGPAGIERMPKEFKTGEHVLVYNTAGHLIALAEALVGRQEAKEMGRGRILKVEKLLV